MSRRLGAPVALLLAALLLNGFGIGDVERGNRHFREGRYAEAVEAYRAALARRPSPRLHYNLGTALLRLGEYDEAGRHLREAAAAPDPELRRRGAFNLGNRFLEDARAHPAAQDLPRLLDAAVEAYREALRLEPGDLDAKWNLELALRARDEQPEQPEPSPGAGDADPEDGAGQDDEGPGGEDADPEPAGGTGGDRPDRSDRPELTPLSQAQADAILSAAEQDERELQRQRLRRGQREVPVARDW
jgi:Ca-activated chloride channel homolog